MIRLFHLFYFFLIPSIYSRLLFFLMASVTELAKQSNLTQCEENEEEQEEEGKRSEFQNFYEFIIQHF